MGHTAVDFKENQWVTCSSEFCSANAGKRLNTSTITSLPGKGSVEGFPGWYNFKTVFEACQQNPEYFTILDPVINNYEIY